MRILQVHTRYRERGGEDAVVEGERDLLRMAGHDVDLLEFHNPASRVDAATSLFRAPWNRRAAQSVVEAAEGYGADVVHVHNTWFALSPAVVPALSRAGFPTVVTIHNYRLSCVNAIHYRDNRICEDCVGKVPWRGVIHRCYRNSAAQSGMVALTIASHRVRDTWDKDADVVVCLTGFAGQYLEAAGVSPQTIIVKPNAVADPGNRPNPPSTSDVLLFVGRLSPEKGLSDLFDAWLTADRAGMRLGVVGDGPLRSTAVDMARRAADVEFLGRLSGSAVAEEMKRSRALVLPSRSFEGMPMVLLEALAAGLPTIVPHHGALPEIVGRGGLTYRSGSIPDLARAIGATTDDRTVDSLGIGSRAEFEDNFTLTLGREGLERVYKAAIGRRSQR